MERESFEDFEVAKLMNEAFINVKVDREERPDIDAIYMTVCQMMTGHGGWPLTILMTPDKRPFFAGTYIPKHSVPGRMGMLDMIPRVSQIWRNQRADVNRDAGHIVQALTRTTTADISGEVPSEEILDQAYEGIRDSFDAINGGFGRAPKFPSPTRLRFLLRYWYRTGETEALRMVGQTLTAMRLGGIYDHVGWGFHRYATDTFWIVPHFEKMLYDQAMLALTYTEAYQVTGETLFSQTAHEILRYVLRDLTGPEGGFSSAEDADSEGEEGKFYVWTQNELRSVLGQTEATWIERAFNVQPGGNFRDEASRQYTGTNILYRLGADDPGRHWEDARQKLLEYRKTRIHPFKDDKVLADWNGLVIAAMARAARVLNEPAYATAASRAATFVKAYLMCEGQLLHRWRGGDAAVPGMLDDYAFMIWGLIELYEATLEEEHLKAALQYCQICCDNFQSADGTFFMTSDSSEELLVRTRPTYDGPVPSGSAVMMMNLLRLGKLTADKRLERKAWNVARMHARLIAEAPQAVMAMLSALDYALGPSSEVVIAGNPDAQDTQTMIRKLHNKYLPRTTILFNPILSGSDALVPNLRAYKMVDGKATAYVCERFACQAPTTDVDTMLQLLEKSRAVVDAGKNES